MQDSLFDAPVASTLRETPKKQRAVKEREPKTAECDCPRESLRDFKSKDYQGRDMYYCPIHEAIRKFERP